MKENFGKNLKQAMSQQMMNAKAFDVDAVEAMKSTRIARHSSSDANVEATYRSRWAKPHTT